MQSKIIYVYIHIYTIYTYIHIYLYAYINIYKSIRYATRDASNDPIDSWPHALVVDLQPKPMRVTASSKHGACTQTAGDGRGVGGIGGGVVSQAPANHLQVTVTSAEVLRSTQHTARQ
jgi:hypothetical protein